MIKSLIIIGVLLIIFAIFSSFYTTSSTQSHLFGLVDITTVTMPLEHLFLPLCAIGAIFVAVGAFAGKDKKK